MDPNYLPFHPNPSKPQIHAAAGRGRRALPCLRARRRNSPSRPSANTRRATRPRRSCSSCATSSASPAQRHRPGELPRHRQHARRRCARRLGRHGARRRGRQSDDQRWRAAALDRAGMRGVRFNFLPRLVDATPHEVYARRRQADQAAGLAHRRLFRGAEPATHHPVPAGAADHDRARPHVVPDAKKGVDHPDFQRYLGARGREQEYLGQGDLSRAHLGQGPALRRRRCRSRARWSSVSPIACCGAPTGRIPT